MTKVQSLTLTLTDQDGTVLDQAEGITVDDWEAASRSAVAACRLLWALHPGDLEEIEDGE